MKPREAVAAGRALAGLRSPSPEVLVAVSEAVRPHLGSLPVADMCGLLQALAVLGVRPSNAWLAAFMVGVAVRGWLGIVVRGWVLLSVGG